MRELCRESVGLGGGGEVARACEELGFGGVEGLVVRQLGVIVEGGEEGKADGRPVGHGKRRGPVQGDDRRRGECLEFAVEGGDLGPIGPFPRGRLRVESGNRSLHLERAGLTAAEGVVEHSRALGDRVTVPTCPILVLEAHRGAVEVGAGWTTGICEEQEREKPVRFGRGREQLDHEPSEADRLAAEVGAA